jgi:integrase/recombinase XerD
VSDRGEELNMTFARYLLEDGKSPKTVESYTGDVRGFLRHLRAVGDPFDGELQRHQVTAYRNHLLQSGYEPATVNKKVNSLQAFNRVASGSERQVEVYPEAVLGSLLSFVSKKRVGARDRAVVLVLLYTSVRVSEFCGIRVRNVDLANGLLKVVGKGGKLREVPLRPEVADVLRAYLAERAKSRFAGSDFLFLGQRGPLQRDAVNTLLERLTRRFGLQVRLKPHTFRHTFCTRLVQRGVPLTTVSKLAGHSNVETTARFYVNSSREEKMQAVNML